MKFYAIVARLIRAVLSGGESADEREECYYQQRHCISPDVMIARVRTERIAEKLNEELSLDSRHLNITHPFLKLGREPERVGNSRIDVG